MQFLGAKLQQLYDGHSDTANLDSPGASNTMNNKQNDLASSRNSPAVASSCDGAGLCPAGNGLWSSNTLAPAYQRLQQHTIVGANSPPLPYPSEGISPSTSSCEVPQPPQSYRTAPAVLAAQQRAQTSPSTASFQPSSQSGAVGVQLVQQIASSIAVERSLPMASLPVVCGHMVGVLQVHRGRVILSANTPEEKEVSATEFERLGGRAATKKWRQSLRLIQPDGTPGRPVGEWYAEHGLDQKRALISSSSIPNTASAAATSRTMPAAQSLQDAQGVARTTAAAVAAAMGALHMHTAPASQPFLRQLTAASSRGIIPSPAVALSGISSAAMSSMQQQVQQMPLQQQRGDNTGATSGGRGAALDSLGSGTSRLTVVGATAAGQQEQQPGQDAAYARTCAAMLGMAQYLRGKSASPPWELLGDKAREPRVCGLSVNLRMLFLLVLSKGGSELVCRSQGWEQVAVQMHLAPSAEDPNPGKELEQIYCDYLLRFEQNAGPQNWPALLQLSVMGNLPEAADAVPAIPDLGREPSTGISGSFTTHQPSPTIPRPTSHSCPATCAAPTPTTSATWPPQSPDSQDRDPPILQPGSHSMGAAAAGSASHTTRQSPSCSSARMLSSSARIRRLSAGVSKRRLPPGKSASEANLTSRATAAKEMHLQQQQVQQFAQQLLPGAGRPQHRRLSDGHRMHLAGPIVAAAGGSTVEMPPTPVVPWMCHVDNQQQQQVTAAQHGYQQATHAAFTSSWSPETFQEHQQQQGEELVDMQQQQDSAMLAAAAIFDTAGAECDALTDQELQELFAMIGQDEGQDGVVVGPGVSLDMASPFASGTAQFAPEIPGDGSYGGGCAGEGRTSLGQLGAATATAASVFGAVPSGESSSSMGFTGASHAWPNQQMQMPSLPLSVLAEGVVEERALGDQQFGHMLESFGGLQAGRCSFDGDAALQQFDPSVLQYSQQPEAQQQYNHCQQQQLWQPAQQSQHQQELLEVPPGVVPLKGVVTMPSLESDVLLDSPLFDDGSSWMDISMQLCELSREMGDGNASEGQMASTDWEELLESDKVMKLTD